MSDVLVIDSLATYGAAIVVVCQRAAQPAPRLIGEESPANAGNLRRSVIGEKKIANVLTKRLSLAEKVAIAGRIAMRRQMVCNGTVLDSIGTLCSIECTTADIVAGTDEWEMQLTVREV